MQTRFSKIEKIIFEIALNWMKVKLCVALNVLICLIVKRLLFQLQAWKSQSK